ncbi:ubiquitin carboxyl-terminal hydrolase 7-like [Artemia franciscana]|uniref:ubiquitin carboxyl-terminal hydrolase 7-like n=1 Tax=Artemia franciscana TaxID=6661 RepID=UPI0032DA6714
MSVSNATMVRNLPWRIMTRFAFGGRFFSFFLQANADVIWSCQAVAELRIVSQKKGVESLTHKIQHRFCLENNKDGFNIRKDIILNPENGYIKDDCVILETFGYY